MEGMRDWQQGSAEAAGAQTVSEALYGSRFAGNNSLQRRVARGDDDSITVQPLQDFTMAGADGSHRAGGFAFLRHGFAAGMHDAHQLPLLAGAGPVQRCDLAQAVANCNRSLHAEQIERMQTGERGGCDARLGNLRIDTGKLRQMRACIKRAQRWEASRPDSAIGVNGRSLSGKEEADAGRSRCSPAEEDAAIRIDAEIWRGFATGKQLLEPRVQFVGSGGDAGGTDDQRALIKMDSFCKHYRKIGQFSTGDFRGKGEQICDLLAKFAHALSSEEEERPSTGDHRS